MLEAVLNELFSTAHICLQAGEELGPKYAYTALWLDIAERRNNIASHLALAAKQLDMTTWPAPVVRLFLGDLSPAETLAAVEDKDPNTKQGAGLRGQFLQGEWRC